MSTRWPARFGSFTIIPEMVERMSIAARKRVVENFTWDHFRERLLGAYELAMRNGAVRILLIQLKRIGDLILTVPAIDALRAAFPERNKLISPSRSALRDLTPAIPAVDRVARIP